MDYTDKDLESSINQPEVLTDLSREATSKLIEAIKRGERSGEVKIKKTVTDEHGKKYLVDCKYSFRSW